MIAMSDDFKRSVSATEREMKGYVEVSFVSSADKSQFTIDTEPEILSINGVDIPDTGLLDDDRKGKNYASLEQDYFKLDGTFVLPNNDATKNPGMGYVSKYTYGEQQEEIVDVNPFHFTTDATGCSGITIYFQNNVPTDLEITVISNLGSETFNDIDITDNGVASVTFSERNVTHLYIFVNDMLYTNRRLRIQEIDFGLSALYEREDLISFKTIEQCNRFADEMPINECEVVLGDYEGKFDVNNPNGITQYLGENVLVKPFVGVVTEDNGIEYCTLGTYWLDEWKNDKNSVTLISKDIFSKLTKIDYAKESVDDYYDNFLNNKETQWGINFVNKVLDDSDYIRTTENWGGKGQVINWLSPASSQIESLQKYAIEYGNTFNSTRTGDIKYLVSTNDNDVLTISKNLMKNYSEIKEKEKIKEIKVSEYYLTAALGSTTPTTLKGLYKETINCNGDTEFFINFDQVHSIYIKYSYSGTGTPTIVSSNVSSDVITTSDISNFRTYAYAYIKFNYVGSITLEIKTIAEFDYTITEFQNIKALHETGNILDIKSDYNIWYQSWPTAAEDMRYRTDAIINYRINKESNKQLKCEFNGNPAIECGDCIEVENRFADKNNNPRYDKVWVTKIESEFNGSFNQTIEGDILE